MRFTEVVEIIDFRSHGAELDEAKSVAFIQEKNLQEPGAFKVGNCTAFVNTA